MGRQSRRYPGRPKLAASEKRESIIRFVVTEAEAAKIKRAAKAKDLSISNYLRSVAIPKE